jgi:branched-subunit amino acid aminotransferase/4-amino-4-deoxychorismate lyase
MSPRVLPRELKCRSRMHYFLADQQARAVDPQARALLLDDDGSVLEATTANVLVYRKSSGLLSPPRSRILPGISVAATHELADALGICQHEADMQIADVHSADEVLLTSTSTCILPVVRLNGQRIGEGAPGPIYRQLLAAWRQLAGLDIADQARQFRDR